MKAGGSSGKCIFKVSEQREQKHNEAEHGAPSGYRHFSLFCFR